MASGILSCLRHLKRSFKTWVLPFNLSILFRKRGSMRKVRYPLSKCFVFLFNVYKILDAYQHEDYRIIEKRPSPFSFRLLPFSLIFPSVFLLSPLLLLSLSFFLVLCSFSFLHARRARYLQKRAIFRNTPGPGSSIPSRLRHLRRSFSKRRRFHFGRSFYP